MSTEKIALLIGGNSDGMLLPMQDCPSELRMDVKQKHEMRFHGDYPGIAWHSYKHYAIQDADGSTLNLYVCGGKVNQPLHQLADGYRANRLMGDMAKHLTNIVNALGSSLMGNDPALTRAVLDARAFLLTNNITTG